MLRQFTFTSVPIPGSFLIGLACCCLHHEFGNLYALLDRELFGDPGGAETILMK